MESIIYKEKPHYMQADILNLFNDQKYLKVCAPMVRYSKLQFRQLVRLYDCDLTFTPMILADCFILSQKAREIEFSTSEDDKPVIAQFASNNVNGFIEAATLVSPFCDGVDLNCGCPQRWTKELGLGCSLMNKPELICSMIKECKQAINKEKFTVSVKTRILSDLNKTIDLCRKLDRAGASFLTIHARKPDQNSGDINKEVLKLIVENVSCPVIANGGVESLGDCEKLYEETNCKGVMSANGILCNPTLFTGEDYNSESSKFVVENWIKICFDELFRTANSRINLLTINAKPKNITFQCFHHHLVFMLSKILSKRQKVIFNYLKSFEEVFEFLCEQSLITNPPFIQVENSVGKQREKLNIIYQTENDFLKKCNEKHMLGKTYKYEESNGKYFDSFQSDYDLGDIFS